MKKIFLAFIILALPLQVMADFKKYTYDCHSDARYYMGDDGDFPHQIVPVGKLGYPDGQIAGLIWFQHQLDGVTYYFAAQAVLGRYLESEEVYFAIDFFRLDSHMGSTADSAATELYDLNS